MLDLIIKYRQLVKFGLVGAANTLFTFSIIFIMNKVFGISYLIVNPIAYLLPTISSFYFNKKWTFRSEGNMKKEGILFFAVIGVAWVVQYFLLYLMVERMKVDALFAQIAGMVVFTGLNFAGQKFITFKSPAQQ